MASKLLSASLEPTTISQLNDDCLFEIFTYLSHLELSAFADTCTRFRELAIDYFPRSKLGFVRFEEYFRFDDDDNKRKRNLFLVHRMVEHFGQFIVKVECGSYIDGLVAPLAQCPNLIEIIFNYTRISDRTAHMMFPLVARLRTLTISHGSTSGVLWQNLPLWGVELRYLRLTSISLSSEDHATFIPFHFHRRYPFRKLVKLSHSGDISDLRALECLVRCNPQLREIRLGSNTMMYMCKDIRKNVPELEALNIYFGGGIHSPRPELEANIVRFSEIKSFTASGPALRIPKIMHEMGKYEISLKYLYLRMLGSTRNDITASLLGDILKLSQLEELVIQQIPNKHVRDTFFEYDAQRIENLEKKSVRELEMQLGGHTAAERIANQIFSRFDVFSDLKGQTTILRKRLLNP